MATKYKYDKDTDYAALMEQAARRGDNAAAAVYEQQRNAKIRGEGMAGQEQTSDYAQYLPIEDVPDYDDTHRREAEALLTGRGTADRREQIDRMLDALLGEQFDVEGAVTFQKAQPFALVAFAETGGLARVGFGGQELRRNRLAVVLVRHHDDLLLEVHWHVVGRGQRQSLRFHGFAGEAHTCVVACELGDRFVNVLVQQVFVAFEPVLNIVRTVEFERFAVGTVLLE